MPDFDAILVAAAARYAPAQVTPPATFGNVRSSTADLPNQMSALPCVMIFPDQGTFETGNGSRRGEHDAFARFYYAAATPPDLPRDLPAIRKWLTVLVDQLKISAQLGGIVASIQCRSWRVGILSYAGISYSGIELGLHIITAESWTAVA